MAHNPDVSVALCTWNGERHLAAQLQSIAAQSHRPDYLLISDDCSTDLTLQIASAFRDSAPFPVEVRQNPQNLGSRLNFQQAIEQSPGELIFLADQDDIWYPDKIERIVKAFQDHPQAGFVFSNGDVVNDNLEPLGYRLWDSFTFDEQHFHTSRNAQFYTLLHNTIVTGATLAFRKKYVPWITPFPENWIHDEWIATVISALAPAVAINEPLIQYRSHSSQQLGAPEPVGSEKRARTSTTEDLLDREKRLLRKAHHLQTLNSHLSAKQHLGNEEAKQLLVHFTQSLGLVEQELEVTLAEHEHFRNRIDIRQSSSSRFSAVFKEWRSGRYHRFSSGTLSGLRDLCSRPLPDNSIPKEEL